MPNPEAMERVIMFDTTLRDGAQDPAVSLSQEGAVQVAHALNKTGVDVIEAGFPVASDANFHTVKHVAEEVEGPVIAAFARTNDRDIDAAAEALEPAGSRARINVCAPVSDPHIEKRLGTDREGLIKMALDGTIRAAALVKDVQFSLEDFTRSDQEFAERVMLEVADTGATTIMLPDTVGAMTPRVYSEKLAKMREALDYHGFAHVKISAHCHNDKGLATANTIDAVLYGGAEQVEVTVAGVGERNGNTRLEEVSGILVVEQDKGFSTGIDPKKLRWLTHTVAPKYLGIRVPEDRPFVGKKGYEHGSGMHQDGEAKLTNAYKPFDPELFGFDKTHRFPLSNQSGKAGVSNELGKLGFEIDESTLREISQAVNDLSDAEGGRNISHFELEELALEATGSVAQNAFVLDKNSFTFSSYRDGTSTSTLSINGKEATATSKEGGVIDAASAAITKLTGFEFEIREWSPEELEKGSNAEVVVFVTVGHNGDEIVTHGTSRRSEEASLKAIIRAVNMLHRAEERRKDNVDEDELQLSSREI